jgi:AmiR/NasT family two-component response regulator
MGQCGLVMVTTPRPAPFAQLRRLEAVLSYRNEVHQAQDKLILLLGVSVTDAMVRLRAHADAHDRPVADVAQDIVSYSGSLLRLRAASAAR